jgi:hypothetical protein
MKLVQMPPSRIPGAYDLGPFRPHHWLQPHWARLLELVHYRAWLEDEIPRPAVAPSIQDCSLSDGDTPGERQGNTRHPRNAHDGGDDFDITYPMTGWDSRAPYTVGPVRNTAYGPKLSGPPTLLAVDYMAAIVAHLSILDRQYGNLVRVLAMDDQVDQVVRPVVLGFEGLKQLTKDQCVKINEADRDISWKQYHQNHAHWRMFERPDGDQLAEAFEGEIRGLLGA